MAYGSLKGTQKNGIVWIKNTNSSTHRTSAKSGDPTFNITEMSVTLLKSMLISIENHGYGQSILTAYDQSGKVVPCTLFGGSSSSYTLRTWNTVHGYSYFPIDLEMMYGERYKEITRFGYSSNGQTNAYCTLTAYEYL